MSIKKVIHYCWFGGKPLPKSAEKCIASWKKYLPEYEIVSWDESNFDVNSIDYTREAYSAGKFAFVSDYARFWILYHNGGVYFDTDVEIICPIYDIVARGPFMGCEHEAKKGEIPMRLGVAPGLGLGACPGIGLYSDILTIYNDLHFIKNDSSLNLKTVVEYTTEALLKYGLKNTCEVQKCGGVFIYPKEYFNPKDYATGKLSITEKTRSIHHFSATWRSSYERTNLKIYHLLGISREHRLIKIIRKLLLRR